jgi:hypothetical protein
VVGTAIVDVGDPIVVVVGVVVVLVAVGADVVGGAVVMAGGAGAVVVVVGASPALVVAGEVVGVVVMPLLSTLKSPRRLELVPFDHVSTTLMPCDPSASFVVSYASAVPSAAVPAKSKGGSVSVRTGGFVRRRVSR